MRRAFGERCTHAPFAFETPKGSSCCEKSARDADTERQKADVIDAQPTRLKLRLKPRRSMVSVRKFVAKKARPMVRRAYLRLLMIVSVFPQARSSSSLAAPSRTDSFCAPVIRLLNRIAAGLDSGSLMRADQSHGGAFLARFNCEARQVADRAARKL